MRVVVMVMTAVVLAVVGAAAGYFLGEYAPGGLAAIGEPFSPIRDAQAQHYTFLGAGFGALVGLMLGGFVQLGAASSAAKRTPKMAAPDGDEAVRDTVSATNQRRVSSELGIGLALAILGLVTCVVGVRVDTLLCLLGVLMIWGGLVMLIPGATSALHVILSLPAAGAAALFVAIVAGAVMHKPSPAPDHSTAEPVTASPEPPPEKIVDVGYLTLWGDYMENEVAAAEKYGGGRVRFQAVVNSVGRGHNNEVVVRVDEGTGVAKGWATLRSSDESQAGDLHAGKKVVLICDVTSKWGDVLKLANCSIGDQSDLPKPALAAREKRDRRIAALSEDSTRYAGKTMTLRGYVSGSQLCDRRCDDEGSNSVELHDPDGVLTRDGFVTVHVHVDDDGSLNVVSQ
jgi:hypothetical protein